MMTDYILVVYEEKFNDIEELLCHEIACRRAANTPLGFPRVSTNGLEFVLEADWKMDQLQNLAAMFDQATKQRGVTHPPPVNVVLFDDKYEVLDYMDANKDNWNSCQTYDDFYSVEYHKFYVEIYGRVIARQWYENSKKP